MIFFLKLRVKQETNFDLALQVMSPCLIPQPNGGPPLIVNMPSYVYPNMAQTVAGGNMAGLIGKIEAVMIYRVHNAKRFM